MFVMQLTSKSFSDGAAIPGEFAFAVIDPVNHIALSTDRNPQLAWNNVPEGTKSFALICHDPDVPNRVDDVNKEDREIAESFPRDQFFHWVLLDIPATIREIPAGSHSDRITAKGKPGPAAPGGTRHGLNDYTKWFAGDKNMGGEYYGYDGPCPPWNDLRLHHYVFTLYALDVPQVEVHGDFTGANARLAIAGHVLAQASLTGTYTLNPRVQPR
jgi:Raf kinase inhibitor-like YbhB/YbcL family protein